MTTSALSSLVGRRIVAAEVIHDYVQLRFDNGDVLNVFNEYGIEGGVGLDVHALTDRCVAAVFTQPHEVRLDLGDLRFRVSLLDVAYRGPEAIEYIPSSGNRVIWS